MIDEAGGGMPFTGGDGGLAAGAAAAVLNIFTTDPTTAAAYADVTESEAQLGEVLAVALQDIPALPELSDHNTPSTGPGA